MLQVLCWICTKIAGINAVVVCKECASKIEVVAPSASTNNRNDEIALMIEKLLSVRKSCCGALFVPVNDNVDAVIAQLRAWVR